MSSVSEEIGFPIGIDGRYGLEWGMFANDQSNTNSPDELNLRYMGIAATSCSPSSKIR